MRIRSIFLVLILVLSTYLFPEVSDLLLAAKNNHSNWKILNRNEELTELNRNMNLNMFYPDFQFGDMDIPIYNGGFLTKSWYHSLGLTAQVNWLLPTDGSLVLQTTNTTVFSDSDGWNYSQAPSLSISYSQPMWLSGKIFEPSLYGKLVKLRVDIPYKEENLKFLIDSNNLVLETVKEFLAIESSLKKLKLKQEELNIINSEVEIYKVNRNNGSISGSEYWKKQLEAQKTQEVLWTNKYNHEVKLENFYNDYGLQTLPELDINSVPYVVKDTFNNDGIYPVAYLKKIQMEKSGLEYDLNRKNYASNLTGSFSLSPNYGTREDSSKFGNSFTDLSSEDSYIDYSFSLSFSLSSNKAYEEKISQKITRLNRENLRSDYEQTVINEEREYQGLLKSRTFLKEQAENLENSLKYAEELLRGEQKLYESGRSTGLLLKQAQFNVDSRLEDIRNTSAELYVTELEILAKSGFDLYFILVAN